MRAIRLKLDSKWEVIQCMDRESKSNAEIYEYLAALTSEQLKSQTILKLPEVENFYESVKSTLRRRQVSLYKLLKI